MVDHPDRLLVRDVDRAVEQRNVRLEVVRHPSLSNPFSLPVSPSFSPPGDNGKIKKVRRTLGNAASATLNHPAVDEALEDGPRRVRQPALHAAVALLLEIPRHARERAAGARRADEALQAAGEGLGLRVDLGPGRGDVAAAVAGGVAVSDTGGGRQWGACL